MYSCSTWCWSSSAASHISPTIFPTSFIYVSVYLCIYLSILSIVKEEERVRLVRVCSEERVWGEGGEGGFLQQVLMLQQEIL